MLSHLASVAAFSAGVAYRPEAVRAAPGDVRAQMAEAVRIMTELDFCPHAMLPVRMIAYRIACVAGPEALAEVNAVARSAFSLYPAAYASLMIAFLETVHLNSAPGSGGDGCRARTIKLPVDSQYGPAAGFH